MEGEPHDYRPMPSFDRGFLCNAQPGAGPLGEPRLVLVHGIRRTEPVSVGLHQLVSDDVFPEQAGRARVTVSITPSSNCWMRSLKIGTPAATGSGTRPDARRFNVRGRGL